MFRFIFFLYTHIVSFLLKNSLLKKIVDYQQNPTATFKNYLLNCVALHKPINFFGLFLRKKSLASFLFVTFPLHPSTQVVVKECERRDGEWGLNESKEVNKGFQHCAIVLLQLVLESIKFTMKGRGGKGTEQVRLVLSMQIATNTILKGSSVLFLIQMT